MTKQADPTQIKKYREKLLTNPASLLQNMRRVREVLRERSEQVFIERDLTASDKAIDEDTRKEEFERLDDQILRVGARIDDLDKQIEAHIKEHPDAELAAKLMEAPPPGAAMSRQHRRQMARQTAKAERRAPEHSHPPQTMSAPEALPTAEEPPKAEG